MGRAPCCSESGLKKGPWTAEEDRKLVDYIQKHGHGSWRALPKKAGLPRCGKSCRLRWTNYLRPGIKRGRFSFEEEDTIIQLHKVLGNKWSAIAARLPGRTDNEIKNHWNTHIRKRLIRMGIDPVTHTTTDFSSLLFSPSSNLHNPAAALLLNLYGLLGLQPATELIRTATDLLSFQCQGSSGAVSQEVQFCDLPADTAQAPQTQQLQDPTPDDTGAVNEDQVLLHQGARAHETGGLWLDDVVSQYSNISGNNDHLVISSTDHNSDPFLSQLLTESSFFYRTDNPQNCNITSGSSTPSSSNNINPPLLTDVVGVEDAEGDSSCSRSLMFESQIPGLLDVSDYYA